MKHRFIKLKKIKSRLTKHLVAELFGEVAVGEKLPPPKLNTVYPDDQGPNRDTSFEAISAWSSAMHIGSRHNNYIFNID